MGLKQIIAGVQAILKVYKGPVPLLLETTAGMGHSLGSRLEDLGEIFQKIDSSRVGLCVDTAHIFEAGYDISSQVGLDTTIKILEKTGLKKLLRAVHLNDSKTPCNSHVDRHENIGAGCIGSVGIKRLVRHSVFKNIPLILETPGFDHKGPDLKNMKIVRRMAEKY